MFFEMFKLYNQTVKNCFSLILIKNSYKVKNEQIMLVVYFHCFGVKKKHLKRFEKKCVLSYSLKLE